MEKEISKEEVLKNSIDSAIEAKTTEVATASTDALEAKSVEINETITKTSEEAAGERALLQKQIDDMKMESKTTTVVKEGGLRALILEKATEIAGLKKGETVTLDLKDYVGSAGRSSAPYADYRVSQIKYDPNFDNRVSNHLVGGSTGSDGAVRHTFETAETDSAAPKTKGSVATQSSVTLTDVHTPIQTLFNVLTLPNEQLNDVDMIETYLSTRLMGNLKDVEDIQLLRGNGTTPNYSGLANTASSFADLAARRTFVGSLASSFGTDANIFDVATAVKAGLANRNFMAKKLFMNPIDVATMVLIKSTQGEYILRQTIAPDGSYKTFWNGVEIIETAAQTAGSFIMLDPRAATYWTREGAKVEFGYNDNDFASNNVTVRILMRGALVTYNANGIVADTFANFVTALNA